MKLCAMAHIPLAAGALGTKTGGSRRRQGAAVPIGTKKVVENIRSGAKAMNIKAALYLICGCATALHEA